MWAGRDHRADGEGGRGGLRLRAEVARGIPDLVPSGSKGGRQRSVQSAPAPRGLPPPLWVCAGFLPRPRARRAPHSCGAPSGTAPCAQRHFPAGTRRAFPAIGHSAHARLTAAVGGGARYRGLARRHFRDSRRFRCARAAAMMGPRPVLVLSECRRPGPASRGGGRGDGPFGPPPRFAARLNRRHVGSPHGRAPFHSPFRPGPPVLPGIRWVPLPPPVCPELPLAAPYPQPLLRPAREISEPRCCHSGSLLCSQLFSRLSQHVALYCPV